MEKITERDLQVFAPAYYDVKSRLGFTWYYKNLFRLKIVYRSEDKEITINTEKFRGSLIKLIVLLENLYLRDYKEIDIYEGIKIINNRYNFSERENYYLLSNGKVIKSQYHKYYRAYELYQMKIPENVRWDGKYDDYLIKRLSKKLVEKLGKD